MTDTAQTPAAELADAAAVQEAYLIATAASEAHPDGFITVDKDGIIDFANRRAARICGVTLGDLRGRPLRTVLPSRTRSDRNGGRSRTHGVRCTSRPGSGNPA